MSGEGELTNVCSVFFCSFAFLTISSSLFTFPTSSFTRNSHKMIQTWILLKMSRDDYWFQFIKSLFVCCNKMKAILEIKLNKIRISTNLCVWFDFYCNFHFLPVINKINFERANTVRETLGTTNLDFLYFPTATSCHFVNLNLVRSNIIWEDFSWLSAF